MYVHALHTVHVLPDLRVAGGRLGDGVSLRSGRPPKEASSLIPQLDCDRSHCFPFLASDCFVDQQCINYRRDRTISNREICLHCRDVDLAMPRCALHPDRSALGRS